MDNTKCFCHFNGFEVKDAKARKSITDIETELIAVNENANNLDTKIEENKTSTIVINEELANVKENVSSNSYDIGVIATGLNTANSNITKNESDISNLNTNLETTNNNVTNNANNISALSEQINNIHTHDNKEVLDSITEDKIKAWDLGNGNSYSTEETIVGVWHNKKPIYRKMYIATKLTTTQLQINLGDTTDIEDFWINNGISHLKPNSGVRYKPLNTYESADNYIRAEASLASGTGVIYIAGSPNDYYAGTVYVVFEYTKISDVVESEV